jgi:PST family polysaccharide transporter
MPLIALGCLFAFAFSDLIVTIAFGEKYAASAGILKGLIPVLFFAFPAQLLGWPSLGTIGKTKQVTISTVIYGTFTIVGLLLLILLDAFTLKKVVILRSSSEIVLFFPRLLFCIKYRQEFSGSFKAECS